MTEKPKEIRELERILNIVMVEPPVTIEGRSGIYILDSKGRVKSLDLNQLDIFETDWLEMFPHLEELDLSNNSLEDMTNCVKLKNLRKLTLSSCELFWIDFFDNLIKLETLDLSYNEINRIENIENLTNLKSLYLGNNRIRKMENLEKLTNLSTLNLKSNLIAKIENLDALSKLTNLNLEDNIISKVENLENLRFLTHISLSENQIENIEELRMLLSLPYLQKLYVTLNPFAHNLLLYIPPNQNNLYDIRNYFKKMDEKNDAEFALPVKIMLLGNHQSGKTTFSDYFINNKLPDKTESTHILNIKKYPASTTKLPQAIIYDFGGQDYYHGLYQAFFSLDTVNLLFWCSEHNRNQVRESGGIRTRDYTREYWLHQLKYAFDKRRIDDEQSTEPVIIVQTHADVEGNTRINYAGNPEDFAILNEFYISLHPDIVNDKTRPLYKLGLEYLRENVKHEIEQKAIVEKRPEYFRGFLNWLLTRKTRKCMTLESVLKNYHREIAGEDIKEYLKADLRQLAWRGLILYYPDNKALENVIWANPMLTIEHIHKEILSKEELKRSKGEISEERFNSLCDDEKIKQLLISEKVIFYDQHYKRFIIPSYLPLCDDIDSEFYDMMVFDFSAPNFVVKFSYFIPFGLINQLICLYGDNRDRKKFWRDQLVFTYRSLYKVWIKLDFTHLEISVYIKPKNHEPDTGLSLDCVESTLFLNILDLYWGREVKLDFEAMDKAYATWCERKKLGVAIPNDRTRTVPKDMYLSVDGLKYVNYHELNTLREPGEPLTAYRLNNHRCIDLQHVSVVAPYNFRNFTNNPAIRNMKKIFISYSRKDVEYKDLLKTNLNLLKQFEIADNWSCEQITVEEWDKRIKKELDESDIIIYMLSANFFSSRYILENEVMRGLNDAVKKKKILCVVISDFVGLDLLRQKVEDRKTNLLQDSILQLSDHQYLPYGRIYSTVTGNNEEKIIPLKRHPSIEEAMTQVMNKLVEIL